MKKEEIAKMMSNAAHLAEAAAHLIAVGGVGDQTLASELSARAIGLLSAARDFSS